ncbi:hypothetical protein M153_3710006310 [Pseudoloma neurophilia]|uniref:Uncharacterized protein n=1 Tax=Pseudoloma neurophilia TaxID=146866 RepID=A0A0R0M4V1_9MICR|nr:hypothetical protein M153_3710006310 [Pseudoloma neurophilia]
MNNTTTTVLDATKNASTESTSQSFDFLEMIHDNWQCLAIGFGLMIVIYATYKISSNYYYKRLDQKQEIKALDFDNHSTLDVEQSTFDPSVFWMDDSVCECSHETVPGSMN